MVWKTPLPGLGIAGPIVWGDRIFVSDSDGPSLSNLHVICLSRDTGRELWHDQFWGTAPTLHHESKSSMATPVPVTDGKHVFSFFGTGDVFCTTLDGDLVWHRSLASEYGPFENRFAASSSPLLTDRSVIVQCDHWGASYVLAIDKATGATAWKVDRNDYWHSWASPGLVPVAAKRSRAGRSSRTCDLRLRKDRRVRSPNRFTFMDSPRHVPRVHSDARLWQRIALRGEWTERANAGRPSRRSRRCDRNSRGLGFDAGAPMFPWPSWSGTRTSWLTTREF